MQKSDQFVQVGQVLKSDGTDGSLVIRLFDNFYESPRVDGDFSVSPFWIMIDGLPVPYFADFVSDRAGGKLIVRLTDVCSREDADALSGKELYHQLDDSNPGGHSSDESLEDMDLRGWKLVDAKSDAPTGKNADQLLGTIIGIDHIPGNPLLIVEVPAISTDASDHPTNAANSASEILIPLHDDFVTFVDADKKTLGMSLPEGLL